jgi:hypothetical protein
LRLPLGEVDQRHVVPAGNTIEVPATSGLKPTHHSNRRKIDYTDPKWEWKRGKGPIPRGTDYTVKPGNFQLPNADPRGTTYAAGHGQPLFPKMQGHRQHALVGDAGTADGLAAAPGGLMAFQGAVVDVFAFDTGPPMKHGPARRLPAKRLHRLPVAVEGYR